ncbi:MAG: sigma-70 family RNA polymerase sigma factor, partial [Bacteroidales bacterium]|nr:sigma-70 family RNA polymerase sigma factor [Bacteroidales bacterium]
MKMTINNAEPLTEAFVSARGRLVAMIGRMLHSPDDVADIVQDAFCRLWSRRDSLNSTDEAIAMATTTARNLCIDRLRVASRRQNVAVDEERDADIQRPTDEVYCMREQFDIVNSIIETRLTPMQQQVLKLREFEGRSMDEIAAMLNMDETAVRMNLSRARKR